MSITKTALWKLIKQNLKEIKEQQFNTKVIMEKIKDTPQRED